MKALIAAATVVVVCVVGLLWYAGFFAVPQVSEKVMGPYTMMYEPFVGDYKKTKPVFDRVYDTLQKEGLESSLGIGIYYDDPSRVAKDQLRSECGAVLEGEALKRVADLEKKYKIKVVNQSNSVVAELPIRNPLSFMTGPMKAYPALAKYIQSKGYAVGLAYEIYDMPGKKIQYVMTIETVVP